MLKSRALFYLLICFTFGDRKLPIVKQLPSKQKKETAKDCNL